MKKAEDKQEEEEEDQEEKEEEEDQELRRPPPDSAAKKDGSVTDSAALHLPSPFWPPVPLCRDDGVATLPLQVDA